FAHDPSASDPRTSAPSHDPRSLSGVGWLWGGGIRGGDRRSNGCRAETKRPGHRCPRRRPSSEQAPGLEGRLRRGAGEQPAVPPQATGGTSRVAAFPPGVAGARGALLLRDRQAERAEEAMKYFTPDLLERFGSKDERIALAAHEELEERSER